MLRTNNGGRPQAGNFGENLRGVPRRPEILAAGGGLLSGGKPFA
jgi:hypothetical protein